MDSEKKARRSSILKPQRPKSPQTINVESTITKYKEKRVSFASSNFVKPFAADPEKNTIWDNTYEEEVNHTDSTKNTDSHADVHLPTLNVSALDNSSLHIPELDKENICPERFELENNSEIKIYNDFEKEPSLVECIKKNRTVIFVDNVMELTSLNSEKPIICNEIEEMEFSTDLREGTFFNQCYESNMDFTAVLGCAIEEKTDHLKKEKSMVFSSISTELRVPDIQNRVTKQNDEEKDILSNNLESKAFTKVLSDVQATFQVQNKADDQGNGSYLNRTEDMEFTNVLPDIQKNLQLQSTTRLTKKMEDVKNDHTLLNASATMEFTNVLPGIQEILKTVTAESKGGGCGDISNVSDYVDMEFTNVLPSSQKILQHPKSLKTTVQSNNNSGLLERTVDTLHNNISGDLKAAIQSKVRNNQTILNESATMEFTNVLPGIQEILKTVPPERKEDSCEDLSKLNQSVDMEFTNILPTVQNILHQPNNIVTTVQLANDRDLVETNSVKHCKNRILGTIQNIEHINNQTILNESITMEFTNVLPGTREILETVEHVIKQEDSCKDLSKFNQTVDMEFTDVLQSSRKSLQNPSTVKIDLENTCLSEKKLDKFSKNNISSLSRSTIKDKVGMDDHTILNKSASMEFTNQLPDVHEILKAVQPEIREYSCRNFSKVDQTVDMEFTNILPNLLYTNTVTTTVQLTNDQLQRKLDTPRKDNISDSIQSKVRNYNTILNESLTMEFTDVLPGLRGISKTVPAKGETSGCKNVSKLHQTVDMEFTNILPNTFQAAASNIDYKELIKSENTVLPSVQKISVFHGNDINTQQRILELKGTSETKNLPKAKKTLYFEGMTFENETNSGKDCSKVDHAENMEILEVLPSQVEILETPLPKLSDNKHREMLNIKDIENKANDGGINQTENMKTTRSRKTNNSKPTKGVKTSQSNKEFINMLQNQHSDNEEKTNTKNSLSENISSTEDRSILYYTNLDASKKTGSSAYKLDSNQAPCLLDTENIDLLERSDAISSINKSSQTETIKNIRSLRRETIYDRGNETDVFPIDQSNNETGVKIMDNIQVDTRDRRSRKTMYFNRKDDSIEDIEVKSSSYQSFETPPATKQNEKLHEQLESSPKNNVLYSEPGYLNAQDMTTQPNLAITPSTSFGINLSPFVSQQRVLATVQPSDSLQDMFKHKSFQSESFSVLDEKLVSNTQDSDCDMQDIVTEHYDVIDLTLKEQPDQLNVFGLDNTSAVLIDDSDTTLDSNCDYTRHCRMILRNLDNYLVPGDTLILASRGKEREKRFKEICKQLEEVKSKVDEFKENFTLPDLDWMNFEDIFKQRKEDSIKDNVTDESLLLETKVPKMKDSRPLVERVQEAAERSTSYWQFIKCEKDQYYFTTLFETLPFIVHLHPELGIVYRVETFKNMKDNLHPVFYYNHDFLQFKLNQDNLMSVLGGKYDILTLLDYICMTLTEVVEFHHDLKELEGKYGSSHKLRMTSDFRIILEILSEELIIWWIISIKLSKTTIGLPEAVTATSELGEKVNKDHIKQISEKIASGGVKLYVETLIQKIDEYVQRVGRGIRYRREYDTVK